MSMMGEMSYFLGLQVKQLPNGIFLSQTKYASELLKKFDLKENTKSKSVPMCPSAKIEL